MRHISDRNIYVRINRYLDAYCAGHKLRKTRERSDTAGSYYMQNPDGSVVDNVNLEELARRLGCLKSYERVGVPTKRTGEEANALMEELAGKIAAGRAFKRRMTRDLAQMKQFAFRAEK